MRKQNDALASAESSPGALAQGGAIRRFSDALRHWVEHMDYGPYDYTLDRIGQLESRVLEVERARNATNRLRSAPDSMTQIGITGDADAGENSDGNISV